MANHDQIYEEGPELGDVVGAETVAHAQQDGGNERATDRAEPAHRDHNQDPNEIAKREPEIESAHDLDCQRAAEPGEAAAQREGDGKRGLHVDAEAGRHALVVHRGAHAGAEAGVLQRRHQGDRHQQPRADQEQTVGAKIEAKHVERAAQEGGHLDVLLHRPEEVGRRRH